MLRIVMIIAIAFSVTQSGCLEPSGTPRDPNSGDAQRNNTGDTPPSPPPGPAQPGSDRPDPGQQEPPLPLSWKLTLSIVAKKSGEEDVYKDQVRPLFDRSCTAAGCHAHSSLIDLR